MDDDALAADTLAKSGYTWHIYVAAGIVAETSFDGTSSPRDEESKPPFFSGLTETMLALKS